MSDTPIKILLVDDESGILDAPCHIPNQHAAAQRPGTVQRRADAFGEPVREPVDVCIDARHGPSLRGPNLTG